MNRSFVGMSPFISAVMLLSHSVVWACDDLNVIPGQYIVLERQSVQSYQASVKASSSLEYLLFDLASEVDLLGDRQESSSLSASSSYLSKSSRTGTASRVRSRTWRVLVDDPSQVTQLRQHPGVTVEPDCWVDISNEDHLDLSPLRAGLPEYLRQIDAEDFWASLPAPKEPVIVAVSDTGVDYTHPDLQEHMWINPGESGIDEFGNDRRTNQIDDDGNGFIDDVFGADLAMRTGDPRPSGVSGSAHGTHVAGLIAAKVNRREGTQGLSPHLRIMALKAFPDEGSSASLSDLIRSIYYAVDHGARVINCSWGARKSPSPSEREAFEYAHSQGVTVVVAAGNNADNARFYSPASLETTITVGSVNSRDEFSSFSNYGDKLDIVAPGGDLPERGGLDETLRSIFPVDQNSYGNLRGTSMAAPLVAATAGILLSLKPEMSPEEIRQHLRSTGDPLRLRSWDAFSSIYQHPRLNVRQAVRELIGEQGKADLPSCGSDCSNNSISQGYRREIAQQLTRSQGGCQTDLNTPSPQKAKSGSALFLMLLPLFFFTVLRRRP